jgi:hypothetical protein
MTGGRASNQKGAGYERDIVKYLNARGIACTRAKRGNKTGDIPICRRLSIEAKNHRKLILSKCIDQMKLEKLALGADYGCIIAKRERKVEVGEHYFIMTVEDGINLLVEAGVIEVGDAG